MTTITLAMTGRTAGIIATAAMFAGALILTSVLAPQWRIALFREDGPLENLSAALFFGAAIIGWRKWARSGRSDVFILVVSLVCAVAALDELSFGERVFGFAAPVINGVKIDGLHDLLDLAKTTVKQWPGSPYLWTGLAAAILAPPALWTALKLRAAGWSLPPRGDLIPICAATTLIAIALLLDVQFRLIDYPIIHALGIEEIFETTAGLLLAVFVASRPVPSTLNETAHQSLNRRSVVVRDRSMWLPRTDR